MCCVTDNYHETEVLVEVVAVVAVGVERGAVMKKRQVMLVFLKNYKKNIQNL